MQNITLLAYHGGPLHYLGNRFLTLPDLTGHMKPNAAWLADIFSIITGNGSKTYKKCYEPFAGSASFSLAAMEMGLAKEYIINDSNHFLINTLQLIRDEPHLIKDTYASLIKSYQMANSKKDFYIAIINKYNEADKNEKSLLLPFIINHAWGGRIFHNTNHDIIYHESIRDGQTLSGYLSASNLTFDQFSQEVDRVSLLLNTHPVSFKSGDFIHAISGVKSEDFIMLNPPYPENERSFSNKTHMYTELYSPEKLHENLKNTIHRIEENDTTFFITYGFYNRSMNSFVLKDTLKTKSYFYLLGYPECAFGMPLDQIYLSSHLKVPDGLKRMMPTATILANQVLDENEALQKFLSA